MTFQEVIKCNIASSLIFIVALLSSSEAFSCACCADVGDRFVEKKLINSFDKTVLSSIKFAKFADLSTGPRDLEDIKGIKIQSLPLSISVQKRKKEWIFRLEDGHRNVGHLRFELPQYLTKFHIDPRDPTANKNRGGGPIMYKEWKMTSKARGDGIIQNSVGGDQKATLILQGRGNHCSSASDFNAWSIVLYGSKAHITLFGDLRL